jgi:hypothetical protein
MLSLTLFLCSHVRRHSSAAGRKRHSISLVNDKLTLQHYKDESHSFQGKTGKTHAIC